MTSVYKSEAPTVWRIGLPVSLADATLGTLIAECPEANPVMVLLSLSTVSSFILSRRNPGSRLAFQGSFNFYCEDSQVVWLTSPSRKSHSPFVTRFYRGFAYYCYFDLLFSIVWMGHRPIVPYNDYLPHDGWGITAIS